MSVKRSTSIKEKSGGSNSVQRNSVSSKNNSSVNNIYIENNQVKKGKKLSVQSDKSSSVEDMNKNSKRALINQRSPKARNQTKDELKPVTEHSMENYES